MLTDEQLIVELGDCTKVADLVHIKPPSVSGWKKKNLIPTDKRIFLAVIAEKRGIATRQQLFPTSYQDIWPELRTENNVAANKNKKHVQKVAP